MGAIYLKNLQKTSTATDVVNKHYTFTDVAMDIHQEQRVDMYGVRNRGTSYLGKDLAVTHDEASIADALYSLFATSPGDRLLLPTYGCDIRRFIGENITANTARGLGEKISASIKTWEPRVTVTKITVAPVEDRNEYWIDIRVSVPILGIPSVNVFAKFSKFGDFTRVRDFNV